jgi:CheY-like chemotaxis protein
MTIRSGIPPLDERLGGLRRGGLYLLAGTAGSGRLAALIGFLNQGLSEGRVGLVTAAPPSRVFEEAGQWGSELEGAWREGRFRLLTLRADFERRLTSAAEPADVFSEMAQLLGSRVERLALYPGTALWESRAGTALASQFLRWVGSFEATTVATIAGDLEDARSPATEWVLQASSGIFTLEALPDGFRSLTVRRASPSTPEGGPITLELRAGSGFVAASGHLERRSSDAGVASGKGLLILRLDREVPPELVGWAQSKFRVETAEDPFQAVELLQQKRAPEDRFRVVLIHLSRSGVPDALRACRAIRRLTRIPIFLTSGQSVRSSDRIRALDSGASDLLSDPVSIPELASRIDRALIAGSDVWDVKESHDGPAPPQPRGVLDSTTLSEEVVRRAADPLRSVFTFLHLQPGFGAGASGRLGEALLQEARSEDGDLVGGAQAGFGVLLQGARPHHAEVFLTRVRDRLGPDARLFRSAVMGGSEVQEILSRIEAASEVSPPVAQAVGTR